VRRPEAKFEERRAFVQQQLQTLAYRQPSQSPLPLLSVRTTALAERLLFEQQLVGGFAERGHAGESISGESCQRSAFSNQVK
jgi:hypothetical protein